MLPYPGDMNAQPFFVYEGIRACQQAMTKLLDAESLKSLPQVKDG